MLDALKCWIILLSVSLGAIFLTQAAGAAGGGGPRRGYGVNDPFTQRNGLDDYAVEWRFFKSGTEKLRQTLGTTNAEAAALLTQVQTNALFLQVKWDDWFRAHGTPGQYAPSDPYLRALQADYRLLDRLKKEKDGDKALAVLRDVAFDLQTKADNCRNSSDGLGKEIKVKVHTKANGQEVGGFEVFYVSKGMLSVKSAHDRFPRQSSPTDEKILPPGGYAFWTRKNGVASDPVPMRIGGGGEKQLEVDLEVPSQ